MEENYKQQKKKAKSLFQLSNMVVELLSKVTFYIKKPFVSQELGEQFANAINYCLDSLVSEKGLKLKVKDPERFHFEPRELTINLLMMYANMSQEEEFIKNVVNDGRSYSDSLFKKALTLI